METIHIVWRVKDDGTEVGTTFEHAESVAVNDDGSVVFRVGATTHFVAAGSYLYLTRTDEG